MEEMDQDLFDGQGVEADDDEESFETDPVTKGERRHERSERSKHAPVRHLPGDYRPKIFKDRSE